MPLPDYVVLRNAVMELVRQETEEIEKASSKWKR